MKANLTYLFGIREVASNMHLKQPLDPSNYEQWTELFNSAYEIFQVELNIRENRPTLFGRRLFIDARDQIDDKINGFWHVASIGADDSKFDMYPCSNDVAIGKCVFLCNVDHQDNFLKHKNSTPCIYRASRISWIRQIIDMTNDSEEFSKLKIWTHERNGEKHLLIRYQFEIIDYIIIFKISYKNNDIEFFRLITAFPVVLKSFKKRYDREYNNFGDSRKPGFLRNSK